jgi:hypothetical protein
MEAVVVDHHYVRYVQQERIAHPLHLERVMDVHWVHMVLL